MHITHKDKHYSILQTLHWELKLPWEVVMRIRVWIHIKKPITDPDQITIQDNPDVEWILELELPVKKKSFPLFSEPDPEGYQTVFFLY